MEKNYFHDSGPLATILFISFIVDDEIKFR
jgi:hypothetical protein